MSRADQKLHRKLLAYIYDVQSEDFYRKHVETPPIVEEFDDLDRVELRYHIKRLQDNRQVELEEHHSFERRPSRAAKSVTTCSS